MLEQNGGAAVQLLNTDDPAALAGGQRFRALRKT
jgi:hypothetical protein